MPPLFIAAVVALVLFFVWRSLKGKKASAGNIEAGKAFLQENLLSDGVNVTESGLQYTVLTQGTGTEHPSARDSVTVHYHGTLLDGSVFDSSVNRGEPIAFPLSQVIPGWTEGVQLMVVGEKTRFFIPSNLAYGNRGAGSIGPGSTLIFEVELLAINA
jgi:peptidylprolyl isomerase